MVDDLYAPLPPLSLWDGLEGRDEAGDYLHGGRCSDCGTVTFMMPEICPECWAEASMLPARIGRSGRVYTLTTVHQAPPGFDAPYVAGLVDLDEGIRIFAHLEAGVRGPAIGDRVELSIVPLRRDAEGRWLTGPRYAKPA